MNKYCFCLLILTITWIGGCRERNYTANAKTGSRYGFEQADQRNWPSHFGFGHKAADTSISKLDIDVRPDGKGLPAGGGNAVTGIAVYRLKCMTCHGGATMPSGIKLQGPVLITNPDSPAIKTIGNYWPYASTIFDDIKRAMPYNAPGSLNNDEVYALTACLLHANGLIDSTAVFNARTLPAICMPARKRFVVDDRQGGPTIR